VRASGDREVLDLDVRLVDRGALHALEDFPGLGWCQFVDERRGGGRIGELLGGGLEDDSSCRLRTWLLLRGRGCQLGQLAATRTA
jgi:hypothetical protein